MLAVQTLRAPLRVVLGESRCARVWTAPRAVMEPPRAIPPEQYPELIMSTATTSLYSADEGVSGGYREATFEEIMTAARQALARRVRRGTLLDSPGATRQYLTMVLGDREYESFCCLFLDNRHRLIEFVELFRGTIDGASVHPREVVKEALKRNAAALILCHPHPSGVAEPSQADELITRRLREALALVDIRVLDHLVVAGDSVVSMAELGLL